MHRNTCVPSFSFWFSIWIRITLVPKFESTVAYRSLILLMVDMFHFLCFSTLLMQKERAHTQIYSIYSVRWAHTDLASRHCNLRIALMYWTYQKSGIKLNLFYVINVVRHAQHTHTHAYRGKATTSETNSRERNKCKQRECEKEIGCC